MPLEVVFGQRAERDLDEIDDLLADYSLTAAEVLTQRIMDRCAWLAEFARAGVSRDGLGDGFRSFAIPGKVTVIHRFDERTLPVPGIFHAGEDVERAFSEDPSS